MRKLGTVAALAAGVLLLLGVGTAVVLRSWSAPPVAFASPKIVTIKHGESLRTIAAQLENAGVIRSSLAMRVYARWTHQAQRLMPGDYLFKGGQNLSEILERLASGDSLVVTVSIPEGLTVHQIGERLTQAGLPCEDAFDHAGRGSQVVGALGLGTLGAEGYLFPATYRFSPSASCDEIMSAMLERFFAILTPAIEQRMFELGLTARQVVTMASIVEKEARVASERPLIAGVFYNRLRLGIPLQSDPTAQYNFEGTKERAVQAIRTRSAFNTYGFVGLPPGPIANPGWPSIKAALYPAHTDYLYFVARGDGTHIFSHSLMEHNRAIGALRRTSRRSRAELPRALAVAGRGELAQ